MKRKYYIEKTLSIMLCMLVIGTSLPLMSAVSIRQSGMIQMTPRINPENGILDQQQLEHKYYTYGNPEQAYNGFICLPGQSLAQSFVPTLPVLTRVKLHILISDPAPDHNIVISIRDELQGDDLVTISKTPQRMLLRNDAMIEFEFRAGIEVVPGETYFIVYQTPDVELPLLQHVSWAFGERTSYNQGDAFLLHEGADPWMIDGVDFIFETYGME